jgi:hypothetical protein
MLNVEKDMAMAHPTRFGVQVTNEEGAEVWIDVIADVKSRSFDVRVDMNAGFTPAEVTEALQAVREAVMDGSLVLPLTIPLWELQTPDDFTSVSELVSLPADA